MEPIDLLRDRIAKFSCGKYRLPAIVLSNGRNVSVICCCHQFANELRAEIAKTPDKELANFKVTFITGSVEFV